MSKQIQRRSRRNFLMTLGAGSAATAAAIAVRNATPSQAPDHNKRATRGYQASEHVDNYYRTTKV